MYDKKVLHTAAYNLVSIIFNCIDDFINNRKIKKKKGMKSSLRSSILSSHITYNKVESKLKHISCFHSDINL